LLGFTGYVARGRQDRKERRGEEERRRGGEGNVGSIYVG
jgi:hypothetical protein